MLNAAYTQEPCRLLGIKATKLPECLTDILRLKRKDQLKNESLITHGIVAVS